METISHSPLFSSRRMVVREAKGPPTSHTWQGQELRLPGVEVGRDLHVVWPGGWWQRGKNLEMAQNVIYQTKRSCWKSMLVHMFWGLFLGYGKKLPGSFTSYSKVPIRGRSVAFNDWGQPPRSCECPFFLAQGNINLYNPWILLLSSYIEPSVVGVRTLDLSSECLVYYLCLLWEVTSLLSDSVSSSVKQYTHLPLRNVPVYQVWPQLVFLPWRKFELFHPRSLKCFSLLWLWSCACEAGGLGGCPLLENFEQNSGGGQHTRSAFTQIVWTQYSSNTIFWAAY